MRAVPAITAAVCTCLVLLMKEDARADLREDATDEAAVLQIRQRLLTTALGEPKTDAESQAQFDAMLRRVVSNGASRDPKGSGYWDTMRTGADRTNVLWRDVGRPEWQFWVATHSLTRLLEMSRVYAEPNSPLYRNPGLAADIVDGVNFVIEQKYNARYEHRGWDNWFDIEISIPVRLLTIALLLQDAVPAVSRDRWLATVEHFAPDPTKVGGHLYEATGANRMWKARVTLMLGALRQDPARITVARGALDELLATVEKGDGFRDDGTFIQHRHFVYNGGYGLALMADYAQMMYLLDGTRWAIDPRQRAEFIEHLERGFLPTVYRGAMFDMMRGREIARAQQGSLDAGLSLCRILLRTALSVPDEQAARLRALAKGWLIRSGYKPAHQEGFSAFWDQSLIRKTLDDTNVIPADEPVGFFAFNSGTRVIHRTPAWAAALSMTSNNVAGYESINGENRRGWNTGQGHLAIVMTDPAAYARDFWPTVDAKRLAGTTVVREHALPGSRSKTAFVGGAGASDGSVGVATMQLAPADDSLAGRASWFFFRHQVVCVGTDLSTPLDHPLETIVENRLLPQDALLRLHIDGRAVGSRGLERVSKARTALINSGAQGESIGIYFFQPTDLNAVDETRVDSWRSINSTSLLKVPDVQIRNRFAAIWIDHGVAAQGARYAYVMLPGATAGQLSEYASRPTARLLKNDSDVQAVEVGDQVGIVFGAAVEVACRIGTVRASSPCIVAVTQSEDGLELSIAHPSATTGDRIAISFKPAPKHPQLSVASADAGIDVAIRERVSLTLTVANRVGQVRRVRLVDPR